MVNAVTVDVFLLATVENMKIQAVSGGYLITVRRFREPR